MSHSLKHPLLETDTASSPAATVGQLALPARAPPATAVLYCVFLIDLVISADSALGQDDSTAAKTPSPDRSHEMQPSPDLQTEPMAPPTLWQVFISVAWSFFGVQNSRTRRRDFTHGKPWHFIILGVVMTVLVVLGFAAAAQLALHFALQP